MPIPNAVKFFTDITGPDNIIELEFGENDTKTISVLKKGRGHKVTFSKSAFTNFVVWLALLLEDEDRQNLFNTVTSGKN